MFKDVHHQQQQQQQKAHLVVHHTLPKILLSMANNHLLRIKILKLSVLVQQPVKPFNQVAEI